MRDLNDIQSFAAVVTHNGFAPAARALGVPKSGLSRRVARLEERLGVRLIERSTRHIRLTDAGTSFFEHCERMLAELHSAEESILRLRTEPTGLVRVAAPTGFNAILARIAPAFMQRYPGVRLQFVVTNRRVDLIEEQIDIALRARSKLDDTSLTMRTLGRSEHMLVASPDFLAANGPLTDASDLAALPFLSMDEANGLQQLRLFGPGESQRTLSLDPMLRASDLFIVREAVIAGLGFALLPDQASSAPLRDGRLVRLLPEWRADPATIHLVFTGRRGLLPAVRAFIDHLAEQLPLVRQECLEV